MAIAGYERSIEEWRAQMDADIRSENGLLAQAGLFWLNDGVNTLGSSPDCEIRLPKRVPLLLGAIELKGAAVTLTVDIGQSVDVDEVAVRTSTRLRTDQEPPASSITFKGLRMVVVGQGNRLALRLWDNQQARDLPPRAWFPIDGKYRIQGSYTPYPAPARIELPNAFGRIESGYVQGYVTFRLGGRSHNLDAAERDDGRLHLQFADLTNGGKTYPGGRYLHTEPVLEDGHVFLDFNRAFNPPCAFKDKEPCTLAPGSNHLKVAIEAGELYRARS